MATEVSAEATTGKSRRQRVMFYVRVGASAVMLAVLLTQIDTSSLVPSDRASALMWALVGLAVMLGAMVLATLRWQRVIEALDISTPLPPLLAHSLAGQFVANFLPSTIGGDVVRVSRLSASTGQGPASFASVVLERLTGFLVLPLITLVALVAHPSLLHLGTATRLALALSLGTLVTLLAILAVVANPRVGRRLESRESWLRFANAVHLGIDRIRRHPRAVASVLLTAVAYQLAVVMVAWTGTRALDIDIGLSAVVAFVPVVAMAQVIPLSVNGLGLRESALVLLLTPLGVGAAQAVALGLFMYFTNLLISLLGAPAFAVGARPVRAAT